MGKGLFGTMDRRIGDLIKNPGMPREVLEQAKTSLFRANKSGLRDAILRRANQGSARGLFDSGRTQQGFQSIESDYHGRYMDALNELEMKNAQMALQSLGLASSHLLGKRGLNIQRYGIDKQHELGMGHLGVARSQAADSRAWREFQMNLIAQGYSPYQANQFPNAAQSFANLPYGRGPRGGSGRAF